MAPPRRTLVLGLATAVAIPLAVAGPAAARSLPGGDDASPQRSSAARDLADRRTGAGFDGSPGVAAATAPATGVGAPTALYVSDPGGTTVVTVDASAAPTGTTRLTDRTNVVAGPAGDVLAYTRLSDGATVVASTFGSRTVTYPAVDEPVAWAPLGDGFAAHVDGTYVAQLTDPATTVPFTVPDGATDPAVSPYGGEAIVRVPTDTGGSDLAGIPSPFAGMGASTVVVPLGLDAYAPGAPAIGQEPDGDVFTATDLTYLAFVGERPGTDPAEHRLFVDHQDGGDQTHAFYGAPVDVADAGFDCDVPAPAFTPDRRRIAYVRSLDAACTSFEVDVVTAGSDGRYTASTGTPLWTSGDGAEPPTSLSWLADNPRARSLRVDGADRYEVAAYTAGFWEPGTADAVVVAGGKAYADALTGTPLAAYENGPTLLTPAGYLHPAARWGIEHALAPGGTVYILGGTASVSSDVWYEIRDLGYQPRRIGGADRYAVAVNVAKRLDQLRGSLPDAAFVSAGTAFADALVAGPAAALEGGPVLLSRGDVLPPVTRGYLDSLSDTAAIYAIGGTGAASVADDPRSENHIVGGATRYDVAGNVATRFFPWANISAIADGRNWPDAASGGALMAGFHEPILLTNGRDSLPEPTAAYLYQTRASSDYLVAFGGLNSVPQGAFAAASAATGRQTTYYGPDTTP